MENLSRLVKVIPSLIPAVHHKPRDVKKGRPTSHSTKAVSCNIIQGELLHFVAMFPPSYGMP